MNQKSLLIREAVFSDLQRLRSLRLEALRLHPEAFGSDYERDKISLYLFGRKISDLIPTALFLLPNWSQI